jgi:hypothetical protein
MDDFPPDDIFDIDAHLEKCGSTSIRASLGNPSFRPVAEIPPNALDAEVDRILEFLAESRIDVDLGECTAAEAYRFLTTELMQTDIEDPRLPGDWRTGYIYSEFHPEEEEGGG